VSLSLSRYDLENATWSDLAPQTVLVRWAGDKGQQGRNNTGGLRTSLGSSPTALDGVFSAVEPFDIATGDRFMFDGLAGHIGIVWPVRNGRRRAGFVVDADRRAGP